MKKTKKTKKMKNKITATILLIAAALTSCGPLGKYKPVDKISNDMYGRGVIIDDTISIASRGWEEVFTDTCLQNLIREGIANNLDLKMAYEHVKQADAQLLGAKLAYVPTLGLSPNISGTIQNGSNPIYNYFLTGYSSWQIDIFGQLATKVRTAKANKEEYEDFCQATRVQVISDIANLYYTLLMLDAQIKTSREVEMTWKKSVETIHILKREGFADEVAVRQYEATYANMSITTLELAQQIIMAENALSVLVGKPVGTIVRGTLDQQALPLKLAAGVPVQLLQNRPDVRAAQKDCEVAFYTTKSAWLNFFPTLSIAGTNAGLMNAFGAAVPMTAIANLSASLVAPIFNAGVNRSNLKMAESAQREAGMRLDKAILTAGQEVNDAMVEYNTCTGKILHYDYEIASLIQARNDTETLMQNSEGKTYLDVLTAHNALIDAMFAAIANKAQRMQAAVSFYAALGGGAEYNK